MTRQGPSNEWELETRRILQEQLPEYDIDPHIRLANVIKGKIRFIRAMSQYEIDFTVREKETGHVICAIELDGPTHDTEDGQRRDANKNKWLHEAGIPLIRIRKPKEAYGIRNRMSETMNQQAPNDNINYLTRYSRPQNKSAANSLKKYITSLVAIIAIAGLIMWTLNLGAQKVLSNIGKNAVAQQQRMQQENQQLANQQKTAKQKDQAEAVWRKQQEAEQAEARQRVAAQQPRYERMLIKGKSARECTSGNVITNETIRCTKDHYEMVLVNGTQ